jgi:hypothetical protein
VEKVEAMNSDLDVYRSAKLLIDQHGDEAAIHAAMRTDELLDAGDLDGVAVWRRIIRAIEELQRKEPGEGEAVN